MEKVKTEWGCIDHNLAKIGGPMDRQFLPFVEISGLANVAFRTTLFYSDRIVYALGTILTLR